MARRRPVGLIGVALASACLFLCTRHLPPAGPLGDGRGGVVAATSRGWMPGDHGERPALRAMPDRGAGALAGVDAPGASAARRRSWSEQLADVGFVGTLVSIYVVRCFAVSSLWILSMGALRAVAHIVLQRLPPDARPQAAAEVETVLLLAGWGGVASYAIWTAKDVLDLMSSVP